MELKEHSDWGYAPRTRFNADQADLTVAFAVDFTTAGERCTRSAAKGKYVSIPLHLTPLEAARLLLNACIKFKVKTLNIAGNGIYTLTDFGYTQLDVIHWVYRVLKLVNQKHPIKKVVSGGQTGVDLAGGVAAYCLGIDVTMTYPLGFRQRGADGVDTNLTLLDVEFDVQKYITQFKNTMQEE